jgi:ribosomal protein S18 acetylase RimI-like enzyme
MRLYESAGFREVGRRKNYYTGADGQIYDALTLAKSGTL